MPAESSSGRFPGCWIAEKGGLAQLFRLGSTVDADHKRCWVGFNLVKGIGAARLRVLLDYFGDIESAWKATPSELEAAGLNSKLIEALRQVRNGDLLERTLQTIQAKGIGVLTWEDASYPRRLSEIDQPPPVLYVRGQITDEDQWSVSVVGTRRVTPYGRQATEEITSALARSGLTVVSGLARGVDALAHQTALKNGGRTIAVLGSGVDQLYPPEHRILAEQIAAHGAVVSDYPPGTPPEAANFPPRNRIISGLSQAVAIIEAGEKSGALITAAFAAEQGREVFALPGSIYGAQSKGTNTLIREGAHILLSTQDILETLNLTQVSDQRLARAALPSDATEAKLYNLIGREPMHVDEIRTRSNLPIEQVSAALTMMELKGLVRQVGGMNYVALYEAQAEYEPTPAADEPPGDTTAAQPDQAA
jgi:DNA processing protein